MTMQIGTTESRLSSFEKNAVERNVTVETVAREQSSSPCMAALAAVLDRARELERLGREYAIESMIAQAEDLRQGVLYLGGLYDAQIPDGRES